MIPDTAHDSNSEEAVYNGEGGLTFNSDLAWRLGKPDLMPVFLLHMIAVK